MPFALSNFVPLLRGICEELDRPLRISATLHRSGAGAVEKPQVSLSDRRQAGPRRVEWRREPDSGNPFLLIDIGRKHLLELRVTVEKHKVGILARPSGVRPDTGVQGVPVGYPSHVGVISVVVKNG